MEIFYRKTEQGIGNIISKGKGNSLKKYRNQRGRWNTSSTNTKLFPAISTGHAYGSPEDMNIITSSPTVVKQSKNLFSNTTHHMTKREIFAGFQKQYIMLNEMRLKLLIDQY